MTRKNLPNIPIYIGDWERDCNVLSLEAEAAWFCIVRKMWLKGKQNTYKASTKALQNLWRCTADKVQEIIHELQENDICEITINARHPERVQRVEGSPSNSSPQITFTCRRFVKENQISQKRRKAVSTRYQDQDNTHTKDLQNTYKTPTKHIQNTDIEIDNDNDNEIVNDRKGGMGENHCPELDQHHQELCEAFSINEIKNAPMYFQLHHFLRNLTPDELTYHMVQLDYYQRYKAETRQSLCNPRTWIDEHWQRQDYKQAWEKITQKQTVSITDL